MSPSRYFSSTAVQTQLANGITAGATNLTVNAATGYPVTYPFTLIVDLGTDSEEIMDVTGATGSTFTVTRGVDGTTPLAHSVGAAVVHGASARDHRESQAHIAATGGVHGIAPASSVVGTTDTQALSNKTLAAPTITGGTLGSSTINTPTINTPAVTGGTWSAGTISGATVNTSSLTAPTIADLTNAQHDHGTAAKGANIPQSSVTGLPTRLTNVETVNTTQDGTLTTHETRITNLEYPATASSLQGGTYDTTSTTYTVTATSGTYVDCAVTFIAPASGVVLILWKGNLSNSGANSARMAPQVRLGSTVGSGAIIQDADDNHSIVFAGASGATVTAASFFRLPGLTPGSTYNVRLLHRVSGGTGTINSRDLTVTPLRG